MKIGDYVVDIRNSEIEIDRIVDIKSPFGTYKGNLLGNSILTLEHNGGGWLDKHFRRITNSEIAKLRIKENYERSKHAK